MNMPVDLLQAVQDGALVVSGSRLWGSQSDSAFRSNIARKCVQIAIDRKWSIILGDAKGFDACVALEAIGRAYDSRIIMMGCEHNGDLRLEFPEELEMKSYLVPGGNERSCYVIRDKAMAELASLAPQNGFIGCWNGKSKGTIHTARFCHELGIKGRVYCVDGNAWNLDEFDFTKY